MSEDRLDIRLVLSSWGRSRALNDAYDIDYPHASPYCADMRTTGTWAAKVKSLNDDHHAMVDRHVSELKLREDNRYPAIVLSYVHNKRDKDIARHLKCSVSSAREARIAGENWLDGRIEINLREW